MHEKNILRTDCKPLIDIDSTTEYILSVQKTDGEIPWSKGGKTDPWDHVESAMGLTVCGCHREARKAYLWSAATQMDDGSWWSYYEGGRPRKGAYKDTNMTAYISVGVLHYYTATGEKRFLNHMWKTVCRAMDFVVKMQGKEGKIFWAKRADNTIDPKALLTGSCSVYLSITCALQIASLLGKRRPQWDIARKRLRDAIRHKPNLFDQSKSRYAMDWYYPVLSGVIQGKAAQRRIESLWDIFTIPGWGVRCVSERPWVTMGETAELCISLAAMGNFSLAETVLGWLSDKKCEDGAFWTGITVPDEIIYPEEKTTWTGAAVLLAADILYGFTPASKFFCHGFLRPLNVYEVKQGFLSLGYWVEASGNR